jgi:hypothetical protein
MLERYDQRLSAPCLLPLPTPKLPTKENPNLRSAPQCHPLAVADSGVVAAAPPSEFPSPAATKPSTSKLSTRAAVVVALPTPAAVAVALATPAGRIAPGVGRTLHRMSLLCSLSYTFNFWYSQQKGRWSNCCSSTEDFPLDIDFVW